MAPPEENVSPTLSPSPERRKAPRRQEDRRLQQRDRELEAARQITEGLFQHLEPDGVIEKALRAALEVVGAESGSILLAVPESQELVFRHSIGASPVQAGTAVPWDKGIAGDVFHSGKPVVICDVQHDERHFSGIDTVTEHVTRDMIALPLKRWEGEPIGVLEVLNKRDGALDENDLALLTIVSAIAASSIERARLYHEAKVAEVVYLLGDIGHDIKNLLMPVICGAGLLEDEVKEVFEGLPEQERRKAEPGYKMCKEVVTMLGVSSRRIQDRVKEISDCVKGMSTEPQFAPCQMASVVKAVFEALTWIADQRGLSLKSEGLDTLPGIVADEGRLFNALYNLINNAIPEVSKGGSVSVFGKEQPSGVGILISVSDTGRGMPAEVRDSLFTARAKSRKAGGTGLGTKIVKDVVDAHSGRISVESEVGRGTTFYIHLPLSPPGAS